MRCDCLLAACDRDRSQRERPLGSRVLTSLIAACCCCLLLCSPGDARCVRLVTTGFPAYHFGHEFGFTEGELDFVPSRQNPGVDCGQSMLLVDIELPNAPAKEGAAPATASLKNKEILDDKLGMDFVSVHPDLAGVCVCVCVWVCVCARAQSNEAWLCWRGLLPFTSNSWPLNSPSCCVDNLCTAGCPTRYIFTCGTTYADCSLVPTFFCCHRTN